MKRTDEFKPIVILCCVKNDFRLCLSLVGARARPPARRRSISLVHTDKFMFHAAQRVPLAVFNEYPLCYRALKEVFFTSICKFLPFYYIHQAHIK